MAALTTVASSEAFWDALEKCGLLSADAFAKVQAANANESDPKLLARQLVKAGTLTTWQATQLLHGRIWLIVGKYKLLDQVGTGDIGRIYLAEHVQMNRRHLLKVLSRRYASDPVAVKRFVSLAQQACSLDHRNISHIYDVNQEDDWHFVVMEHVEGQDLASLVEKRGALPLGEALEYVRQTVEGLHHAHTAGVVHGDLKPANLIREASGTIKILDIGQAGMMNLPASSAAAVEETGETPTLETVVFRAPEVVAGQPAEKASDIYSLGGVLCFLLTGKPASSAAAAGEQLRAQSGVPSALAEICGKLMAEGPENRPASALDAWNLIATAEFTEEEAQTQIATGASATTVGTKSAPELRKGKKLRVAQRLEPDAAGELTFQENEPNGDDAAKKSASDAPFSGLVINPRPREVKQPAEGPTRPIARALPTAKAAPLVEENAFDAIEPIPEVVPAPATTQTPLILAGVLGGVGVLAVVGIAVLVWALAARKNEPSVAQNTAAKAAPTAVKQSPSLPAEPESNPVIGGEANPVIPVPPPPPPPAEVKPEPAPPAAVTPTPPQEANKDKSAEAPPAAKLKVPGEPESPKADAKPEEKKKDAKSDAKSDAKPPAKRAPKAPPSPFRGFTAAVNLPPLPDGPGQQPGDALAALTLGPCKLAAKDPLEVTLKGGTSAHRDRKLSYELAPVSGKPREWEIAVNGGETPLTIATLGLKDDSLMFQWTEKAVEHPQPARYLCNCLLELNSGMNQHRAALRMPVEGEPLAIEVDRRVEPLKWQLPDLPPARQVFITVAACEGFEQLRVDPAQPVNLGEQITVWTGPNEKSPLLAFRIETKASSKVMSVSMSSHVKLEGSNLARPYSKKDLTVAVSKTSEDFTRLQKEMTALREKKPTPPKGVSTAEFNKRLDEYMKIKLPNDIATRQSQLEQLTFLTEFAKKADEAKIHFRVFHEMEDGQIDLLKTYTNLPAKGKKK